MIRLSVLSFIAFITLWLPCKAEAQEVRRSLTMALPLSMRDVHKQISIGVPNARTKLYIRKRTKKQRLKLQRISHSKRRSDKVEQTKDSVSGAIIKKKKKRHRFAGHFEKALYLKQKGLTNRALIEFLKATHENPKKVRAFYEQALIFQQKGYLKLAESSLEQALVVDPDYQQARILLATVHIKQGNLGGAVQELGRSLGIRIVNERDTISDGVTARNALTNPAAKRHDASASANAVVLQSVHNLMAEPEPTQATVSGITENRSSTTQHNSHPEELSREQTIAATTNSDVKSWTGHNEGFVQAATPSAQNSNSSEGSLSYTPDPSSQTSDSQESLNLLSSGGSLARISDKFLSNLSSNKMTEQTQPARISQNKTKPEKTIEKENEDEWATRLKYLAEHGTTSLKDGEAFIFAEDTGEATLFLADGRVIRRNISPPRDAKEVAKLRRPDIFVPDDITYNLSLLAKLLPKQPELPPNLPAQPEQTKSFRVNDVVDKSQDFWTWLKHLLPRWN